MKRRDFIAVGGAAAVAGCSSGSTPDGGELTRERFEWRIVTSWPPGFPGLSTAVDRLVREIERMSAGRLRIRPYAAGELVPAFEVFDAVSRGTVEMGHSAAYYWRGKVDAAQFFASIPFGLTAHEMNGWLYRGGGLELWRELYAPFDLVPFPAGNTGVQTGGWFNRRIDSLADLEGLRMRIPGLGGEVLGLAGGTPVSLPGTEVFTALQNGSIDAAEWVGPYNDVAAGLDNAARYYYYPGWQEPGPTIECLVNREAWNALPDDLKAIVEVACQAANTDVTAEFMARNASSLEQLEAGGDVEVLPFPDEVLIELERLTQQVIERLTARDPAAAEIWESYSAFMARSKPWQRISEQAILRARDL